MWRVAGRWYGPRAAFLAAFGLNVTAYYGLAVSTFALPDGPLLFFWLLTLDRLSRAMEQPSRTWPWIGVGLAWGGAMLSKYHAVFLPAGMVLLLLLHRPLRHWLFRPGPYIAAGLGCLVFSPVLVWNASHHWASFLFQGGRAVGGLVPHPDYLATALLAQAGYLLPWIWIPLVVLLYQHVRNWNRLGNDHERLALCLSVLPVAAFTGVACFRPVLPHWGLIGLVSLLPALGDSWSKQLDRHHARALRGLCFAAVFPVLLMGLTIIEHRTGWLQRGGPARWGLFEARNDPTADLYGWDLVAERLEELGVLDEPNTFLFTRNWYQSAQLAHAIRLRLPVLCYNLDDPRGFAFWSKPDDWLGHDGILLVINDDFVPVSFYRPWFQDVVPLAEFTIERSGRLMRKVQVYRLIQQRAPFPFDFSPERLAAREALRAGGHPLGPLRRTVQGTAPGGTLRR